ncbi:MAG: hypothetical protein LBC09_07705 [Helicobacteraceae bacterium]|jgi:hypothetical protein|nr:hypothetical protein [Helicobacteraceae bacterium]
MQEKENEDNRNAEICSLERRNRDRAYFALKAARPKETQSAVSSGGRVVQDRSFLGTYLKIVA